MIGTSTVVIINGKPTAGKDTFINMCNNYAHDTETCYVYNISSVDMIKDILEKKFAWNGIKDKQTRDLISMFKDWSISHCDVVTTNMYKRINDIVGSTDDNIIFICIRENTQVTRIRNTLKVFGYNVVTLWIDRHVDVESIASNKSDLDECYYDPLLYNRCIVNNSTLDKLKMRQKYLLKIY